MTANIQRPTPISIQPDNIPQELKDYQQFVCWHYQPRGEKWTKVPTQPDGKPASTTDFTTWHGFDQCIMAYHAGRCDGVGFVTSETDPFVLIDLDHVMPADGPMLPWAKDVVRAAINEGCYVEVSVGGDGIHIIGLDRRGSVAGKPIKLKFTLRDGFSRLRGARHEHSNRHSPSHTRLNNPTPSDHPR